jgi:hypothetical protein
VATLRVLASFDPLTGPVSEKEETQSGKVGKKRKKEEKALGEPCEVGLLHTSPFHSYCCIVELFQMYLTDDPCRKLAETLWGN